MENYICMTSTELPGYMQAQIVVPEGEFFTAGQVFLAENLDNEVGNKDIFIPEVIDDARNEIPVIIINNGFEELPDDRRPDGQLDYTQYLYKPGTFLTAVRLLPEIKFELSKDCVLAESEIEVGGYLIPEDGSRRLMYTKTLDGIESKVYLMIENFKSFQLGGLFGNKCADTMVVRVKYSDFVKQNGLRLTINITDGLKSVVEVGTVVATLGGVNGTTPYTYKLNSMGVDNDYFELDNNLLKAKMQLVEPRIYEVSVTITDNTGAHRSAMVDINVDYPDITAINVTLTNDMREKEANVEPNALVGIVNIVGGTPLYSIELSGEDSNRFYIDNMLIRVKDTALTEKNYNLILKATDSKNKTFSKPLVIPVGEPYPEIESVEIKPIANLTAPVLANAKVGDITILGGTAPYTITFPAHIGDNDLFIFEDVIKAEEDINEYGNKNISVHVKDAHGKEKDASGIIMIAAPEISEVSV